MPEVPLRGSVSGSLKMKVQNFFSSAWHALQYLESLLGGGVLLWVSNYTQVYSCGFRTAIDLQNASQYGIPVYVKPSRKSTSCHYIKCNNALVHWRSKVASILATSTTETELISAASCSQDVFCCLLQKTCQWHWSYANQAYSFAGRQ